MVETGANTPPLALPQEAKFALLNIGSNIDPIGGPAENDPSILTVAFEPLVHSDVRRRPRLYVVPAAISDAAGLALMNTFAGNNGLSSSLLSPAYTDYWNAHKASTSIVPVVSAKAALAMIPRRIEMWLLKTDLQGLDTHVLRAGGEELRRLHYITSEASILGLRSYRGSHNDFCADMLPLMLVVVSFL